MLFFPFGKPSKARFAQLMTKAMREVGVAGPFKFNESDFQLKCGKPTQTLYLTNAYADYCKASWRQRQDTLRRYARTIFEIESKPPDNFAEVRNQLLPNLRDLAFYGNLKLLSQLEGMKGFEIAHVRLTDYLSIEVARDLPDSKSTVSTDQLQKWGVSVEDALAAARDNLWKISNKPFNKLANGTYASAWHDTYDASRVYLHDLVWQLEVKGRHVAAMPTRDHLFVTGSDDEEGLAMLADSTKKVLEEATRPLGGMAIVLEGQQWKHFLPPLGHPSRKVFWRLYLVMIGRDYDQQKGLLDKVFAVEKRDVFVANFMVKENKTTGELRSFGVWTFGIDTLLPKTDIVVVGRPKGAGSKEVEILGMADWVRVESLGFIKKEDDLEPPRYQPRSALSNQEIAALQLEKAK